MRVTYIGAGAAGMICGSCLRDNALARRLREAGCEVLFVPVYTPITTDTEDESDDVLLFGGVSVFLEQKSRLFRMLPKFLWRWLDRPGVVRRLTAKRSLEVEAVALGELALSMLRGEHGNQRKEVDRAVRWIRDEARPHLVNLTNLLIAGFVPALKEALDVPVLVTLQGDDLFLDELTDEHRPQVIDELRKVASEVDGFVTFSEFYADAMSELLEIPRDKFHLVPLGIEAAGFAELEQHPDRPPTVGYFGRVAPEKGFGLLVDAFIELHRVHGITDAQLKAGGWLGAGDKKFFEAQLAKLRKAGLLEKFDYIGSPNHEGKLEFFRGIDVFSMPTLYREPKGMSVLEALAAGLPVVQPRHGAFPEMIDDTGGGVLFEPGDAAQLSAAIAGLLDDSTHATELGEQARSAVLARRTDRQMAEATLQLYERILDRSTA